MSTGLQFAKSTEGFVTSSVSPATMAHSMMKRRQNTVMNLAALANGTDDDEDEDDDDDLTLHSLPNSPNASRQGSRGKVGRKSPPPPILKQASISLEQVSRSLPFSPEQQIVLNRKMFRILNAVGEINVEQLRQLADGGANVNCHDPETGCTPLHLAVMRKNTDAMNLFISRGAKVNAFNKQGQPPIVYALDSLSKDRLFASHIDQDLLRHFSRRVLT